MGKPNPGSEPQPVDPAVGLCSVCAHGRVLESARGSVFWRCAAAASVPTLPPYPRLPVRACPAFEAGAGARGALGAEPPEG